MNTDKNSMIKQWLKTLGLAIALLLGALAASGILFTGAVVQNTNGAIKETAQR